MSETKVLLDVRKELTRLDNLREEALKIAQETRKLSSDAAELDRDRRLSLVLVAIGIAGSFGGFVAGVIAIANLIAAAHGAT